MCPRELTRKKRLKSALKKDLSWFTPFKSVKGKETCYSGAQTVRRQLLFPLVLPHQEIEPRPSMCREICLSLIKKGKIPECYIYYICHIALAISTKID